MTAANPALYNGRMLLTVNWQYAAGRLDALFADVPYAAFLHWRDAGFPDTKASNIFGSAVVMSGDGALLLGRMGGHTANAGLIYPFGGSLEPMDVNETGRADIAGSARRELHEETGLDAVEAEIGPPLVVHDGPRISVAFVMRFPDPADVLLRRIDATLAMQDPPEIADVVVIRSQSDIDAGLMPGYTQALIGHLMD